MKIIEKVYVVLGIMTVCVCGIGTVLFLKIGYDSIGYDARAQLMMLGLSAMGAGLFTMGILAGLRVIQLARCGE